MNDYLKTQGRIFDIQRYSIHDGPGIRTIIFLKGCPLRCRWCCNPEGQEWQEHDMLIGGKIRHFGEDITVEELIPRIIKDEFYFVRSGGGVTLSGGECMAQPNFAAALLHACHDLGYDTAIETTGYQKWELIEKSLPYLNHVLMDIKHMDSAKHKEFTGVPNEIIHENAHRFANSEADLIIRVPVIPGFNNTPREIRDIAEFAASLNGVKHLHLLPYHRLGEGKYEGLGRDYALHGIEPMGRQEMENLLKEAEKSGLKCQIGG